MMLVIALTIAIPIAKTIFFDRVEPIGKSIVLAKLFTVIIAAAIA